MTTNTRGEQRKTGFEIEFGNVGVADAARRLEQVFGGELREKNPFVFYLNGSELGELRIERDASLLTEAKYREFLTRLQVTFDEGTLARELEQGVDHLARNLVPCEVVTSPLTYGDFEKLDAMLSALADLDAEGTQVSLKNAYGTHINPEIPSLDATTIRNYLQSFLLLMPWIVSDSGTDLSRRFFTRFIDPFPDRYCEKVLDPEYEPSRDRLIDDYLEYNPTRNRALDMLPIFAEIDREHVVMAIKPSERQLIKKRPAFHYRLPDCRLGDGSWRLADEWNRWWLVEVIANDNQARSALLASWREVNRKNLLLRNNRWVKTVAQFIASTIKTPDTF